LLRLHDALHSSMAGDDATASQMPQRWKIMYRRGSLSGPLQRRAIPRRKTDMGSTNLTNCGICATSLEGEGLLWGAKQQLLGARRPPKSSLLLQHGHGRVSYPQRRAVAELCGARTRQARAERGLTSRVCTSVWIPQALGWAGMGYQWRSVTCTTARSCVTCRRVKSLSHTD
jgi:hypothetical protein